MKTIPPLAGICTYDDAASSSTTVDENVAFLRRLARIEHRTLLVLSAHLSAVPEWEAKCALALHLWQDAEHCAWLRTRVTEMRKPPHYLDRPDDPALEAFFEELLRSPTTRELLTGVYGVLKTRLLEAIGEFRQRDNPLADQPTLRLLRFLELEERDQLEWADEALSALGGADAAWAESSVGLPRCGGRRRGHRHAPDRAAASAGDRAARARPDTPARRALHAPLELARAPARLRRRPGAGEPADVLHPAD